MSYSEAEKYLRRVIELSQEMIDLAYAGDACRTDAGCGIVFGSLRDKAYKVRKLAETELQRHGESQPDGTTAQNNTTPTKEGE